jgi:hypothetical protein
MNLIADSGRILATDSPLPTQKAATPPSAYIRVIADIIAFAPRTPASGLSEVPPRSGGLVIRKTFKRSNGAVDVRETVRGSKSPLNGMSGDVTRAAADLLPPLLRLPRT